MAVILLFHHIRCITISPYKLYRHLNKQLYHCDIITDCLSEYSEASEVDRTSAEYISAVKKCESILHITTDTLEKFPTMNTSNTNDYLKSTMLK